MDCKPGIYRSWPEYLYVAAVFLTAFIACASLVMFLRSVSKAMVPSTGG